MILPIIIAKKLFGIFLKNPKTRIVGNEKDKEEEEEEKKNKEGN
jgi:hypothetical protein